MLYRTSFSGSQRIDSGSQRAELWPWLMGGMTFFITILFPILCLPINYDKIPNWLIVMLTLNGSVSWKLFFLMLSTNDPGDTSLFTPQLFPVLVFMLLLFLAMPIALTISSVLAWRRVVNRALHITMERGMLAALLATAFSLLTVALLDLLSLVSLFFLYPNTGGLVAGLTIMCIISLVLSSGFLPGLLIAGAMLANLQARSQAH
jgi:hypothetical protein